MLLSWTAYLPFTFVAGLMVFIMLGGGDWLRRRLG